MHSCLLSHALDNLFLHKTLLAIHPIVAKDLKHCHFGFNIFNDSFCIIAKYPFLVSE